MDNIRILYTALGATLAWLIGGFDELFKILVVFAIIDYLSGVTAAWMNKEVSSSKGLRGIAKKVFLLSLVVVAAKIDYMMADNGFLRNTVIYALICNEGISILENCGRIGVPIPSSLFSALNKLNSSNEVKGKE